MAWPRLGVSIISPQSFCYPVYKFGAARNNKVATSRLVTAHMGVPSASGSSSTIVDLDGETLSLNIIIQSTSYSCRFV